MAAMTMDRVAVAGPRLFDSDGAEQRPWWDFPSASLAWSQALGAHRFQRSDFTQSADVPFVVGACLLVRTDAFQAVGGFDERYWLYGEEADLCKRLSNEGWRVHYVAEASASHVGGASAKASPQSVSDQFLRGSDRFVLTHEGPARLVAFRLATLIGAALRLPMLGRDDPRRSARRQVLRHAARSLTRQPDRLPPPEAEDPPASLVVCSLEAWDDVWRRNQFLVRELTDSNPSLRVLFVEPAVDPLHELVRKRRLPHLPGSRLRPVPGRPHVLRFQPIKLGPRRFGDWVDRSIARQVIRATPRAEIVEPTLWMNDLALISVANQRSWPIVYDITDDWLAASAAPRELAVRTTQGRMAARPTHTVVVCSRDLARTKGATRHVRLIPNAVDRGHFTTPRVRPHDLPPAPVAVYVGTLHDERVDVDLIVRTAAALPELRVALIGPSSLSAQSTQRLSELPNVDLMGPRPYDDVPAYLQHATVILVPHVVSEFTESLDPIKAYEYAVVGRPTIATAVAGLRDIGPPVNCVTAGEFPEAVKTAIVSPPESSTVEVPSWRRHAKDFQNAIDAARKTAALGYGTHEGQPFRVLRVWHSGVIGAWHERERELSNSGVAVHLLAAHAWNEGGVSVKFEADAAGLASPVQVAGSHPFLFLYDPRPLIRHLRRHDLSLVDLEEEPASLAALEFLVVRWLARSQVPFCLYSAQNIAKRYPPPFRWIDAWRCQKPQLFGCATTAQPK